MKNKTILITGASRGIGLALAKQLSVNNTVLAVARDKARLDALAKSHGVIALPTDLSERCQVEALIVNVATHWPELSVLFNNAAIQQPLDFLQEWQPHKLDTELTINLHSPIRLCHGFIPLLAAQKESWIINTTSVLAVSPKQSTPVYNASKAALRLFTQALRYQLHHTCIKVCEVIPPVTNTALSNASAKQNSPSPEWVAGQILSQLNIGKTQVEVGQARLGMILHRWLPNLLHSMLIKG
ncbi:MAG: SDR family NAD(P)-dependent oxidoreductase [Bermanella sp.]